MMKRFFVVLAICVLAFAMPGVALAANSNGGGGNGGGGGGGNGSGGGAGGGSEDPLTVVSASVEEGATVAPVESVTVVFSKNVCDASVREANQALASAADASGKDVPVTVVLADDQVEPDKRNDMVIEFAEPLKAGAYTVTVKAGVTSKSGDALADDYTLSFTVEESGSSSAAAASASSASASSASASSASASSSSASAASNGNAAAQQDGPNVILIVGVVVVVIAVVIGAVAFARKRK